MPGTIRYHLDESCRLSIARALRHRGIDVTTTSDAGLLGATDEQQLDYAHSTGRMLFTHDPDFIALHDAQFPHAGLIYSPQQTRAMRETVRLLVLLWEMYEADELLNRLEYF